MNDRPEPPTGGSGESLFAELKTFDPIANLIAAAAAARMSMSMSIHFSPMEDPAVPNADSSQVDEEAEVQRAVKDAVKDGVLAGFGRMRAAARHSQADIDRDFWDRLEKGGLVRHKASGRAYTIVNARRESATAMTCLEISNPSEWEIIAQAPTIFPHLDD